MYYYSLFWNWIIIAVLRDTKKHIVIPAPQELKASCEGEKTFPGNVYTQARGQVSVQISDKWYVQYVFEAMCLKSQGELKWAHGYWAGSWKDWWDFDTKSEGRIFEVTRDKGE